MATALIPLAPANRETSAAASFGVRVRADFVASLIAVSSRAPQTRTRRRAEPGEAIAAYAALSRLAPPSLPGDLLTRSL